jgi:hypothetical protein
LGVLIAGSKAVSEERAAIDTAPSPDDCLKRRNELVSNFMNGFVNMLKKRDPEVVYSRPAFQTKLARLVSDNVCVFL